MRFFKHLSLLIVTLSLMNLIISCGEKKAETQSTGEELVQEEAAPDYSAGEKIYNAKCAACHMANGEGIQGAFPPLAKSDYLLADKKRAVKQVLNGSHEEMVVNGITYNAEMPPQVETYQEAVDVINYVLNAWGNDEGSITVDEVKDIEIVRK